jgi:hypothetical protein
MIGCRGALWEAQQLLGGDGGSARLQEYANPVSSPFT